MTHLAVPIARALFLRHSILSSVFPPGLLITFVTIFLDRTFTKMKIEKIWLSGIRTLHVAPHTLLFTSDPSTRLRELIETDPLSPGDINILMGENGSGKSTIIDIIRSLSNPSILGSLCRENPNTRSWPLFSIQIKEEPDAQLSSWSYLFAPSIMGLEYIECRQVIEDETQRFYSPIETVSKDAHARPISFKTLSSVFYSYDKPKLDVADQKFIDALNKIAEHLPGLQSPDSAITGVELLDKSVFTSSQYGLKVWLKGDMHMPNNLRKEWLPAGWQALASLAHWASEHRNAVLLIEEPETHLHPTLMYPLMKILREIAKENTQQLFITTHSASLLNAAVREQANIFHTKTTFIEPKPNLGVLVDALGYKASDILQANCVIWVEGPSDRTYLNFWIKGLAKELEEGDHYTIMFYGGRLLSHLGGDVDDENAGDFIRLTGLNRHSAIIMDSDKAFDDDELNETKKRIVNAFRADKDLFAWVTEGREIENYINVGAIRQSIKTVHKTAINFQPDSKWSNLLKFESSSNTLKCSEETKTKYMQPDKVRIAIELTSTTVPDYSVLDLGDRMAELVSRIRKWNR